MEAKFKNSLKLGLVRANKLKMRILNECEEGRVTLRMCLRQGREQDAAKIANTIVMGSYRTEALSLVIKYMTTLSGLAISSMKTCGESDNDLKCAVQSLVFSSPYFPELTELTECRQSLITIFGKGYFNEANARAVDPLLSAYANLPSVLNDFTVVQNFVCGFAKENRIDISTLPLFTSPQPSLQQAASPSSPSSQQQSLSTSQKQSNEKDKDKGKGKGKETEKKEKEKDREATKKTQDHKLESKKSFSFFGLFDSSSKKAKSEIDPTKCLVVKDTLKEFGTSDIPTRFTIQLNDTTGAPCANPDLQNDAFKVHVLVSGPEGCRIVGTYTDNKDGTLTGEFTPHTPGLYAIAVYCGKVLLGGEALMQKVKPLDEMRKTDPAKCTVDGPGLKAPMANDLAVFTVTAVDALGDRRPGGADKISVLISGPGGEHIVGDVDDNGDGTYTASFLPVNKGKYAIAVYCENNLIGNNGNPFVVNITNDITECPSFAAIKKGQDDDPNNQDTLNNSESDSESESESKGERKDRKDNEMDAIEIESEEDSNNSEITTEPMLCIASGQGLKTGGVAQEMQTFTIRAINSDGKQRLRGGDRFRVFISGPNDLRIRGKVHDLGNGTYTAAYVPPVEGLYNIAIYMGSVPLGEGKPIQVEVASSSSSQGKDGSDGGGDEDDLELMKRFKVLHDPLNSVQSKPGYLEQKKKSAERLKKK